VAVTQILLDRQQSNLRFVEATGVADGNFDITTVYHFHNKDVTRSALE
jgi:hypothetical protein